MKQAQEQTIANDLIDKLNSTLMSRTYYFKENDTDLSFEVRRIKSQCDQLLKVSRLEADIVFMAYYGLFGDLERVKKHYTNAINLGGHVNLDGIYVGVILLLGYFSEALAFAKDKITPVSGKLSKDYNHLISAGGFQTVIQYYQEAKNMQMNFEMMEHDYRNSASVCKILEKEGLSDADVAKFMDFAGEVARENGLILKKSNNQISLDGEGGFLHIYFLINDTPETVANYNFLLAEKIAQSDFDIPDNVHVSFRCAQ